MSLGVAFRIFFMNISYMEVVGYHFTWACTKNAVLQGLLYSLQRVVDLSYRRFWLFLGYVHGDYPGVILQIRLWFWIPILSSLCIYFQISIWAGGCGYLEAGGFSVYFYPRGCMPGYFWILHTSVCSFDVTIGFSMRIHKGWHIHLVHPSYFIVNWFCWGETWHYGWLYYLVTWSLCLIVD